MSAPPPEIQSLEIVQRLTLYERAISPSVSFSALTRLRIRVAHRVPRQRRHRVFGGFIRSGTDAPRAHFVCRR